MLMDMRAVRVPDEPLFAALGTSATPYYLTGSRWAGTAGEDSDWDFIAEDTGAARQELELLGFAPLGQGDAEYQADPETQRCTVEVLACGNVQVKLVTRAAWARIVRDVIYTHFDAWDDELRQTDKARRSKFWNAMYHAVGLIMPQPEPVLMATAAVGEEGDDDFPF